MGFDNRPSDGLDELIRQERRLCLELCALVVIGIISLCGIGLLIIKYILDGLTLGWTAKVVAGIRWVDAEVPVHFALFFYAMWATFVTILLVFGLRELSERLHEVRAKRRFEEVMRRVRAGEDIDHIVKDLRRQRRS